MIRIALIGIATVAGFTYEIPGVVIMLVAFAIASQDWVEDIGKPAENRKQP